MTSRKLNPMQQFVVYVTFPSGSKEYCHLCNIPRIVQGDTVIANGTRVIVHRTASYDPRATRYVQPVPNEETIRKEARIACIRLRLGEIEKDLQLEERFKKLAAASPEAKKLLVELKKLRNV